MFNRVDSPGILYQLKDLPLEQITRRLGLGKLRFCNQSFPSDKIKIHPWIEVTMMSIWVLETEVVLETVEVEAYLLTAAAAEAVSPEVAVVFPIEVVPDFHAEADFLPMAVAEVTFLAEEVVLLMEAVVSRQVMLAMAVHPDQDQDKVNNGEIITHSVNHYQNPNLTGS
jgi:hypothetical protein